MAQPLKFFLSNFINQSNDWKIVLLRDWNSIVGDIWRYASIEKIEHETLVICVEDACWLQELYMLSPLLLRTINEKLDRPRIKRLRFKQAKLSPQVIRLPSKKVVQKHHSQNILAPDEKRALLAVKDPALQKALEQFLYRCHKEKWS